MPLELVTIQRRTDVDLEFYGELLGEVSTEGDGNQRWEEWRIWRIQPNRQDSPIKWVVQRIGRSVIDGEHDLVHAELCKTPVDVRKALRRQDSRNPGRWYMTDSAYEVLELAVENDPRLEEAQVERI